MKFGFAMLTSLVFLFLAQSCQDDAFVSPDSSQAPQLRQAGVGAVYTMDNDDGGNNLLVFARSVDGALSGPEIYPTGGLGNGGGLGSQGAVLQSGRFVLVCNAGSNEISVFEVKGNGIDLVETEGSHGMMPVSLTRFGSIVYVLNAGGDGNIAGFHLNAKGQLNYLDGSTQALSTNASGGAQISFDKSGSYLVVTEKATNAIVTYPVDGNGIAGAGTDYPSAGVTPFGFEFGHDNTLVVSEAAGGMPGASTISSYHLGDDGSVNLVDGPLATGQTAVCWIAIANSANYGYGTNTGSANVTGVSVSGSGDLMLLDPDGDSGSTGAGPIDAAFSRNSKYLYTLNAGDDSITIFEVNNDGSLSPVDEVMGLPATAVGLAAE